MIVKAEATIAKVQVRPVMTEIAIEKSKNLMAAAGQKIVDDRIARLVKRGEEPIGKERPSLVKGCSGSDSFDKHWLDGHTGKKKITHEVAMGKTRSHVGEAPTHGVRQCRRCIQHSLQ